MAPGMTLTKAALEEPAGSFVWTAERMDKLVPGSAGRYSRRDQKPTEAIRLACASCHQLDAGLGDPDAALAQDLGTLPRSPLLPPRGDGKYYLPINFEKHCQACHPLATAAMIGASGTAVTPVALPHRLRADEIDSFLAGRFADQLAKTNPAFGDAPVVRGDRPDARARPEMKAVRDELADLVTLRRAAPLYVRRNRLRQVPRHRSGRGRPPQGRGPGPHPDLVVRAR